MSAGQYLISGAAVHYPLEHDVHQYLLVVGVEQRGRTLLGVDVRDELMDRVRRLRVMAKPTHWINCKIQ